MNAERSTYATVEIPAPDFDTLSCADRELCAHMAHTFTRLSILVTLYRLQSIRLVENFHPEDRFLKVVGNAEDMDTFAFAIEKNDIGGLIRTG